MNVVIIGFMGTGKSTVGRLLSQKLDYGFLDTDQMIAERENRSIVEIFATEGEAYFRSLERKLASELAKKDNLVIATGGGFPLNRANLDILRAKSIIVALTAPAEIIYQRNIKDHETRRPLLETENPLERISTLLAEREKCYAIADIIIDTSHKAEVEILNEIYKKLK